MSWTAAQTPDCSGKHFLITGANSGIGLAAAEQILQAGGAVTMACRNPTKANAAKAALEAKVKGAQISILIVDLADLSSIEAAANTLHEQGQRFFALVNNAGIMAIPRRETADGFEMQLGTNHLGHFALTLRVLGLIDDRVVNVSSGAHRAGRLNKADLMHKSSYNRWTVYGQSKLANLLFTFALHRRLRAAGDTRKAVACHPGYSATNLQGVAAKMENSSVKERFWEALNSVVAQSADQGAWPTTYAATMPIRSGTYWGPTGIGEMWGPVTKVGTTKAARNEADQEWLWAESERLTGLTWEAARA